MTDARRRIPPPPTDPPPVSICRSGRLPLPKGSPPNTFRSTTPHSKSPIDAEPLEPKRSRRQDNPSQTRDAVRLADETRYIRRDREDGESVALDGTLNDSSDESWASSDANRQEIILQSSRRPREKRGPTDQSRRIGRSCEDDDQRSRSNGTPNGKGKLFEGPSRDALENDDSADLEGPAENVERKLIKGNRDIHDQARMEKRDRRKDAQSNLKREDGWRQSRGASQRHSSSRETTDDQRRRDTEITSELEDEYGSRVLVQQGRDAHWRRQAKNSTRSNQDTDIEDRESPGGHRSDAVHSRASAHPEANGNRPERRHRGQKVRENHRAHTNPVDGNSWGRVQGNSSRARGMVGSHSKPSCPTCPHNPHRNDDGTKGRDVPDPCVNSGSDGYSRNERHKDIAWETATPTLTGTRKFGPNADEPARGKCTPREDENSPSSRKSTVGTGETRDAQGVQDPGPHASKPSKAAGTTIGKPIRGARTGEAIGIRSTIFDTATIPTATSDLKGFVCSALRSGPGSVLRCFIERDRKGTRKFAHVFSMYADLEDGGGRALLTARKLLVSKTAYYMICMRQDDLFKDRKKGGVDSFLGKLRACTGAHTEYVLYDGGQNPAAAASENAGSDTESEAKMAEKDEEGIPADEGRVEACSLRRELAVITYNFDKKDERTGKRRMEVAIPQVLDEGGNWEAQVWQPSEEKDSLRTSFTLIKDQGAQNLLQDDRVCVMHQRESRYDPLSSCLVDFRGRATTPSVKNFQLIKSPPEENVKRVRYYAEGGGKNEGEGDDTPRPVLLQMGKTNNVRGARWIHDAKPSLA